MATAKKTANPRRSRAAAQAAPASEVEIPETETPSAEEPAKGVFVAKGTDEQGRIGVVIQMFGVEPTEVQTLLELGVAEFRRKNGLPPLT